MLRAKSIFLLICTIFCYYKHFYINIMCKTTVFIIHNVLASSVFFKNKYKIAFSPKHNKKQLVVEWCNKKKKFFGANPRFHLSVPIYTTKENVKFPLLAGFRAHLCVFKQNPYTSLWSSIVMHSNKQYNNSSWMTNFALGDIH